MNGTLLWIEDHNLRAIGTRAGKAIVKSFLIVKASREVTGDLQKEMGDS